MQNHRPPGDWNQDTVLFDTVFTTIRTVTKRLWVYNRNSGAVKTDMQPGQARRVPHIRCIINGDAGSAQLAASLIRGNDSVQVLVRAVLGDNGTGHRAQEVSGYRRPGCNFRTNGNEQNVPSWWPTARTLTYHRADLIA